MRVLTQSRIELVLVWLSLLSLLAKASKGARGYRRKALQGERGLKKETDEPTYSPTHALTFEATAPTFHPTEEANAPTFHPTEGTTFDSTEKALLTEEQEKDTEQALLAEEQDKDKEQVDDDVDDTDSPTTIPSDMPSFRPTNHPAGSPTLNPTPGAITASPVVIAIAEENITPPPTTQQPTQRPFTSEPTTKPPSSLEPTRTTAKTQSPTTIASLKTQSPTNSYWDLTSPPTRGGATAIEPPSSSSAANATIETLPYAVQLDPFYLYMTMQGNVNDEEGFMDVLVDYMEYNMGKDIEGFQSITYSISEFEQITEYPSISWSSSNSTTTSSNSTTTTLSSQLLPTSNVTVHIHFLTATFDGKPRVPDLVIMEYMEMLLENPEMIQEYIDAQPQMSDVHIQTIDLEFQKESTVDPTEVQDQTITTDAATGEDSQEKKDDEAASIGMIVGITVACFVCLLWMVFLYGVQSRSMD